MTFHCNTKEEFLRTLVAHTAAGNAWFYNKNITYRIPGTLVMVDMPIFPTDTYKTVFFKFLRLLWSSKIPRQYKRHVYFLAQDFLERS